MSAFLNYLNTVFGIAILAISIVWAVALTRPQSSWGRWWWSSLGWMSGTPEAQQQSRKRMWWFVAGLSLYGLSATAHNVLGVVGYRSDVLEWLVRLLVAGAFGCFLASYAMAARTR